MCKYNWVLLLPLSTKVDLPDDKKIEYAVTVMLSGRVMQRSYFCAVCGRTAHKINSAKSGMRLHKNDFFLVKANNILKQYGLPLHTKQQHPCH